MDNKIRPENLRREGSHTPNSHQHFQPTASAGTGDVNRSKYNSKEVVDNFIDTFNRRLLEAQQVKGDDWLKGARAEALERFNGMDDSKKVWSGRAMTTWVERQASVYNKSGEKYVNPSLREKIVNNLPYTQKVEYALEEIQQTQNLTKKLDAENLKVQNTQEEDHILDIKRPKEYYRKQLTMRLERIGIYAPIDLNLETMKQGFEHFKEAVYKASGDKLHQWLLTRTLLGQDIQAVCLGLKPCVELSFNGYHIKGNHLSFNQMKGYLKNLCDNNFGITSNEENEVLRFFSRYDVENIYRVYNEYFPDYKHGSTPIEEYLQPGDNSTDKSEYSSTDEEQERPKGADRELGILFGYPIKDVEMFEQYSSITDKILNFHSSIEDRYSCPKWWMHRGPPFAFAQHAF